MMDFLGMALDKAWILAIIQLPGAAYLVFGMALPLLLFKIKASKS